MSRQLQLASPVPRPVPRVPAWATPCTRIDDPVEAAFIAAALGAAEACRLAADMAAQAERLRAVMPKLLSRAAGEVVGRLPGDDAVSETLTTKNLSRWASRRLFDRLAKLGAVRELSGRPAFRIFGL